MRVVAAVIRDEDLYLACRRRGNHELAGKWEFPGGKVEANETDESALIREISEELGIEVRVDDFIIQSTITHGLVEINMFTYFVRLTGDRPTQSSDHDRLEWLTAHELLRLDWAELDIPVITALQQLS